jgi:hypothetical protein
MTSNSDELAEALQENMKLRLELATEVVEVKGGKHVPLGEKDWCVSLRLVWKE